MMYYRQPPVQIVRHLGLFFLLSIIICACVSGGEEDESTNLPIDQYESSRLPDFILESDGEFYITHQANSEDSRNYTIEGTFTYTTDVVDPENNTYGKIDLHCTRLTLEGDEVDEIENTFCDESLSCSPQPNDPILYLNDTLLGWWVYSDNITYGGKMRINFNYPPELRSPNWWSDNRGSIRVDPK